MSLDPSLVSTSSPSIIEARRQLEICNACRYCEGYCSVFPAMMRDAVHGVAELTHLANLCHNCRGCHYSCQYAAPHAFALNLPAALAEVRQASWERHLRPAILVKIFQEGWTATVVTMLAATAALYAAASLRGADASAPFYDKLPHTWMVAFFLPAVVLPIVAVAAGLRSYWRETCGDRMALSAVMAATRSVARMTNLACGHGEGCNYEKGDRYSNARRFAHQAVLVGFLLCFLATASATVMHYLFQWPAPYGFGSPPKILGVTGGVLLVLGSAAMILLKRRADPDLGSRRVLRGEYAFICLVGLTALSGSALTFASGTDPSKALLAFHLGCVATLFLTLPFTKMVHGAFRLATLIIEAQKAHPKDDQGGSS